MSKTMALAILLVLSGAAVAQSPSAAPGANRANSGKQVSDKQLPAEQKDNKAESTPVKASRVANDDVTAEGAALDRRLTDVYLHRDWPGLAAMVAPDYYGAGDGFEWDFTALQREFPKIQLLELQVERQHVKRLAADVILVNDIFVMRESYENQNISGRYWSGDIWVKRDGRWLLLVEQEIPLK